MSENDPAGAQHDLKKALELSVRNTEGLFEGLSPIWLGRTMGRLGAEKTAAGEESILGGLERLESLQLKPRCAEGLLVLGEHLAETGRVAEARDKLGKAERIFQEMGMLY